MTIQKEKGNQLTISILLSLGVFLYYFGYDICHYIYNQYEYELGSDLRKKIAIEFWDLRFSNYSIIIAVAFYINRFELNFINNSIVKIGFNLALISAVDKLIFKIYDFSKIDIYIFLILIIWEIYRYIKFNRYKNL